MSKIANLKLRLADALRHNDIVYWDALSSFLGGRITKAEFEDLAAPILIGPNLVELHNTLILALLESGSSSSAQTTGLDGSSRLIRKRKRLLPYQGPGEPVEGEGSLRSKRLKRWAVEIKNSDREAIKQLRVVSPSKSEKNQGSRKERGRDRPLRGRDQGLNERGVRLVREGRDPAGTHQALHLATATRAPTLQHISERLALIASQHTLSAPSRQVASLMLLAFESKIKSLVTHALTLTSSSRTISSITPSNDSEGRARTLTTDSFRAVFTFAPHVLPYNSASAMRLTSGKSPEESKLGRSGEEERHSDDPRWQLLAILKERSGVQEVMNS